MRYLDIVRNLEQQKKGNSGEDDSPLPTLSTDTAPAPYEINEKNEISVTPDLPPGTQVSWQSARFGERLGHVVLTAGQWVLVQASAGVGTATFVPAQWLQLR